MAEVFVGADITGDGKFDADITVAGSFVKINDAIFTDAVNAGSGTGGYNTFLAIKDQTGGEVPQDFYEAGFNSDDTNPLDDTNDEIDHSKTHTVRLSDLVVVTIGGVQYYEFRVDLNENNDAIDTQISLDQFKIYTSASSGIQSTTEAVNGAPSLFSQNLVYNMDAGQDISVLLDEANSTGSGTDDYAVLVPISKFVGLNPATTYVYLFAEMGRADGPGNGPGNEWTADGGFEEWNLQNGVTLTGTKFDDRDGDGVKDIGEGPVAGVTIFIDANKNGALDLGERTTLTDANGNYTFFGVAIGQEVWIDEVIPTGSTQTTGTHEVVNIPTNITPGSIVIVDPIGNFNPVDLSGTKYLDLNGDRLTAGDIGFGGVTIFIDLNDDGINNDGISTTTAADGTWSFTGLSSNVIGHKVYEVLPSGYVQTLGMAGYTVAGDATGLNFANFERFDISGRKMIDTNGDGTLQAGETTAHAGVTIFIDQDNDGVLDATELSTTTAADGSWAFNNLGVGFAGARVRELASGDYITTIGGDGILVTGTSGANQTNLLFANFERFDISGRKMIDTNGDGTLQAGETTAHAGVTIFIDQDNDGVLDATELSTTTAADGSWAFNNLGVGFAGARVRELASGDYITTIGGDGILVTGTSGANQTNLLFANFERFDISGRKMIDTNGDGTLQAGETTAHAGVTIFIDQDNDGVLDATELSTTTAADGSWAFNNLGVGFAGARVRELASGDYITTIGGDGILVTGTSGANQTNLLFANFERFDISGRKMIDTNGDGTLQAGETTAHAGVTIFIDQDNDGVLDATELSTTTAADGSWAFNNLGVGFAGARVRELASGDYITTIGGDGILVTGTSGANQTNLLFANFERFDISGRKMIDTNGDGTLQAGETTAHAGVTIFIDQDNDGVLDATELSTTTAADGSWAFNNLGVGFAGARVRELASGDYITTIGGDGILVTGTSGANQTNLLFANFERFDISGRKMIDTNGDGTLQAGETTAHAGVTIFIDQDNDGVLDATELSTTTAADGSWAFNNLGVGFAGARVRELASGDYITTIGGDGILVTGTSGANQTNLLFANFERFDISGRKMIDTNGDGTLQAGETTAHAGVTIFIDQDNDGVLDATELSTTTAADGSWAFNNLGVGFAGARVRELASGDYITTIGGDGILVTGTSGANQTNLLFANFERFDISGRKMIDTNGDGTLQAGETTAHAGVTIFIDQDNDGVLDATELSTTTAADGSWAFNNLGVGFAGARVRELASGDYITTIGGDGILVTGTSGANQTNLLFANFERFDISGRKMIDTNGDGTLQAGETTAHAGVTIFIDQDNDGVLDATELSTTTAADGSWAFNNLGVGFAGARVRELASGDYITTIGGDGILVTGTSGANQTNLLFANFERFDISGRKMIDTNGDGTLQAGETTAHAGVTIFIDQDNDGVLDATELSTTTAADGSWAFNNLGVGFAGARVRELASGDYITTIGGDGILVTGTSGANQTNLLFANFERFDISGRKMIDTNGDGTLQAGETTAHAGVTIFIDQDNDGVLDATELSTTTAADGSWAFNNLGVGFAGARVRELASGDYITTIGGDGILVTGTSGANQTNLLFANFERFDISGRKMIDTNGDGTLQAGETTAHAGVTIFIDQDNDGVLDATELSTTTAADGSWAFNNLGVGFAGARVRELASGDYITTIGGDGILVTGTSGANQTNLLFANFERFDISGRKMIDTNGDGTLQAGETTAHAGVTIFIDQDNDGVLDATELSTTTAADGSWAFNNLGVGFAGARVRELASGDYITTIGGDGILVTGTSGANQTNLLFANFERFDISGRKMIDTNGDGTLQAGETTAHAGVTIFIDQDNDGVLDATELSTTTAADGSWAFNNLGVGFAGARVRELASGDYITTIGGDGILVTGTSGANQTNLLFANFLPDPSIDVEKSVKTNLFDYLPENPAGGSDDAPDGLQAGTASAVTFKVVVTNDGNETLSGIKLTDSVTHTVNGSVTSQTIVYTPDGDSATLDAFDVFVDLDNDGVQDAGEAWSNFDTDADGIIDAGAIEELSPNETFTLYYSLNSAPGQHENTARVEGLSGVSETTVNDSDDANYFVLVNEGPGVRTPGFWQNMNNGGQFWDGIIGNEKNAGQDCFADGELLYAVDGDNIGGIDPFIDANNNGVSDNAGLLIGDYNKNGITDLGLDGIANTGDAGEEDTLFISLADARSLINASNKQLNSLSGDGKFMLGRDMVATWLNYLAGNEIGDAGDTESPHHYLDDAIDWMQIFSGNTAGGLNESFDTFKLSGPAIKTSSTAWNTPQHGIDHSASQLHKALDYYNNTGQTEPGGTIYAHDCDDNSFVLAIHAVSLI